MLSLAQAINNKNSTQSPTEHKGGRTTPSRRPAPRNIRKVEAREGPPRNTRWERGTDNLATAASAATAGRQASKNGARCLPREETALIEKGARRGNPLAQRKMEKGHAGVGRARTLVPTLALLQEGIHYPLPYGASPIASRSGSLTAALVCEIALLLPVIERVGPPLRAASALDLPRHPSIRSVTALEQAKRDVAAIGRG